MPALCGTCGGLIPQGLYEARHGAAHAVRPFRQASRSAARRERVAAAHDRLRKQVEGRGYRRLLWFYGQAADLVRRRAAKGAMTEEELLSPGELRSAFLRAVLPWGKHAAAAGVAFERRWIEQATGKARVISQKAPPELPDITVAMPPEMEARVYGYVTDRATAIFPGIESRLRRKLGDELFKAIRAGDSTREIAKRLRRKAGQIGEASAARIARTECTAAMNHAQQAERDDAGIQWKEWISTTDMRTRTSVGGSGFDHLAPDGQTVRNDRPFVVSGERLMFPGDGSLGASAGTLVNCRCTSVASFPDEPPDADPVPPPPEEPPKPKPPEHLTHTGEQTDFGRSVWRSIGDGIKDEEHARKVGELLADRIAAETAHHDAGLDRLREAAESAAGLAAKAERAWKRNPTERNAELLSHRRTEHAQSRRALNAARIERDTERGRRLRSVLSEVRDVGGETHDVTGDKALIEPIRGAEREFPADWLRRSGKTKLRLARPENGRAGYDPATRTVLLAEGDRLGVAVHELCHRMEQVLPRIAELEAAFKKRRAGRQRPTRIYPKIKGNREKGHKDEFVTHYMGKDYGTDAFHEILSVGFQLLIEPRADYDFWADRDMVSFILGVLAGV